MRGSTRIANPYVVGWPLVWESSAKVLVAGLSYSQLLAELRAYMWRSAKTHHRGPLPGRPHGQTFVNLRRTRVVVEGGKDRFGHMRAVVVDAGARKR